MQCGVSRFMFGADDVAGRQVKESAGAKQWDSTTRAIALASDTALI